MVIAGVAVEGATARYDREYDYIVPARLALTLRPGCRAVVPFGGGNRKRLALVLTVRETPETRELKELAAQVDSEPLLGEEELAMLRYLREQTFCLYFEALRAMVPPGMGVSLEARLTACRGTVLPESLSPEARGLYEYLLTQSKPVPQRALPERLGLAADHPALDELLEAKAVRREEEPRRRVQDERIAMLRPAQETPQRKLTEKQRSVADFISQAGCASVKETCYFCGVTRAVTDRLTALGVLESFEETVYRSPGGGSMDVPMESPLLTQAQEKAFSDLKEIADKDEYSTALLYGVTGSGKTEVYVRLVETVAVQGRGAIVLVPEISLTPQTVRMFKGRFGERVAVLHSSLSAGQRTDEWRRIRQGLADIVVGTRSAVFAPVRNLGLVVIDEEQEHTYHSESAPRFHARQVAAFRCRRRNIPLILCSATPSVESYCHALAGRYNLVTLPGRYQGLSMPRVTVVDMGRSLFAASTTAVSEQLADELLYNLQRGEQSILLLNRRGYNTLVQCSGCGTVERCPHCSIPMTFHAANGRMVCHYCGHSQPTSESCPVCGSRMVRYSGVGTQRVEEELGALFPDARILRMDTDTTMSRFAHEKAFDAFAAGAYDIMVGTQMVAKGLNFPSVTLVGVLMADQSLYADDFRSYERTFSLITQVVGRGGRGELPGRAFIQTYTPDHRVIAQASNQDYPAFYAEEIEFRRVGLYPPYCDICCVVFSASDKELARRGARDFLAALKKLASCEYPELPLRVLGPGEASPFKAAQRYRYKLIVKCRNTAPMRELLRRLLEGERKNSGGGELTVYIDMYYDGNI
jgi:primosomal protein N' (replication factor Y)